MTVTNIHYSWFIKFWVPKIKTEVEIKFYWT